MTPLDVRTARRRFLVLTGWLPTVLSMNSMVAQPAGALGAILLAALADGTSLSTAMIVGGVICALAAPLYIPVWRAERARSVAATKRLAAACAPNGSGALPDRPGHPVRSTQPSVRSTPLCQRAMPAARVFEAMCGSQRRLARSIARRSSRPDQKPTASPAA